MQNYNQFETISVIGLGYIGLPTAAAFSSRRKKVIGVDVAQHAVDTINRGEIHIVEPELDMLVNAAVTGGYLRATTMPEPADAFMIAVPTPFIEADKTPDLSYIEAAAKSIAPVLQKGNLVVLESTSPVGTTEKLAVWLAQARPDLTFPHQAGNESDIRLAYCPERVLPGHIIRELSQNDRVIGGISPACAEAATALYKIFVEGDCIATTARTAELCKLTENAFRDTNIAFANELSLIADKLAVNVWELIELANRHPRVNILRPGPGVGGHCIAVDPWFIVDSAPDEARLIRTAREVNDYKPQWVLEKFQRTIQSICQANPELPRDQIKVAGLGLAFKPDIDDLRESPALDIVGQIADMGFQVLAVEPNIETLPARLEKTNVQLVELDQAMAEAQVVLILVKHKTFNDLDISKNENQTWIDLVNALAR